MKRRGRPSRTPGISRIDQPEKHNHGWFVRLTRQGERHTAFFSDRKHGGKAKALEKAKVCYSKLESKYPPMSRKQFAQIERRPNKSGVVGVTKLVKLVAGRKYSFWQATWSPEPGEVRKQAFSTNRYGEAGAKRKAIAARRAGLRDMKD